MPTLLENGGVVKLWAGWSVKLPASYHQRNEDGSWSAWGADWTVDATIIEASGIEPSEFKKPSCIAKPEPETKESGTGWAGTKRVFPESDGERRVFRLAATLSALETIMSFYVSYFSEEQSEFAESLLRGVVHRASSAA